MPDQDSPKSVNAMQKSKMSSTTKGTNNKYGNFAFALNPVGLKSGANPNKY